MFYLNINGKLADLSKVTFLKGKDSTSIQSIIAFLERYSTIETENWGLHQHNILKDDEKLTSQCIVFIDEKGNQYPIDFSESSLGKDIQKYFEYDYVLNTIKSNITNPTFVCRFLDELIRIGSYSKLAESYKKDLKSGNNISEDLEAFINDSFDDIFYSHYIELAFFMCALNDNYFLEKENDVLEEEFLTRDDYKYYNPGLTIRSAKKRSYSKLLIDIEETKQKENREKSNY